MPPEPAVVSLSGVDAGHPSAALSYQPANTTAAALYAGLGFAETGETDDDEVVARLALDAHP